MELMGLGLILLIALTLMPQYLNCSNVKPNNPRQLRILPDSYPLDDKYYFNYANLSHKTQFDYLVNFNAKFSRKMQDFGQPCDEALHNEWVKSKQKSIFSIKSNESFVKHVKQWSGKICDFFRYLDCVGGNCTCAPSPNQYELEFADHDKDDDNGVRLHKEESHPDNLIFKRKCYVKEGELCNFVRLPVGALPGLVIGYPDAFKCKIKGMKCKLIQDNDTNDLSERCQPTVDYASELLPSEHRLYMFFGLVTIFIVS